MTKYRILTPIKDFTGVVGNCAFANGAYEGPVAAGPLSYFRQAGYSIQEEEVVSPENEDVIPDAPSNLPNRSASKAEWKAYAISQGMLEEDAEKTTRDELAALYSKEAGQ